MKKNCVTAAVFLLFLMARNAPANEAAALYKEGKFEDALSEYMKNENGKNPYILYNIANCHYKAGRPGYAVYYYLKAFKLLPRNPEIRQNLNFVLAKTGQTLVPKNIPEAAHLAFYFLSLYEIKSAAYISFWILSLILSLVFLKPETKRKLRIPFLYAAAAFLLFTGWGTLRSSSRLDRAAVIVKPGAELLSGPGENFSVYMNPPEGYLLIPTGNVSAGYAEAGIPDKKVKVWIRKDFIRKP